VQQRHLVDAGLNITLRGDMHEVLGRDAFEVPIQTVRATPTVGAVIRKIQPGIVAKFGW